MATRGIAVNAWASPPYALAVGGTDFADVFLGKASTHWNAVNSTTGGSARSYVPEMPWNTSCASTALTTWYYRQKIGEAVPYGPNGWCQDATSDNYIGDGAGTTATGGGPSGCATGTPAKAGIVGGTCRGYAKPAWQKIAGNPADGVRDMPDVALFAGSLTWGHIYVVCANKLGTNVSNCSKTYPASLLKAGGTSFGAPIMAGIQALVNQKTKKNWGNPAPVYYQLARTGLGTGNPDCHATLGNKVGASCLFHDVTIGDNDVHCSGTIDCFGTPPSGEFGGGVVDESARHGGL